MNIIALSGVKNSGKDEVCKIIQSFVPDRHYQNKKFAGKLKEIATILTGITDWEDRSKRDEPIPWMGKTRRLFLQQLGTEAMRNNIHTDIWVEALFSEYVGVHHDHIAGGIEYPNWILSDCRFENEAKAVKKRGGVVVRINRPGTGGEDLHESETALDNYDFDFVIHNTSDKSFLKDQVQEMLEYFDIIVT